MTHNIGTEVIAKYLYQFEDLALEPTLWEESNDNDRLDYYMSADGLIAQLEAAGCRLLTAGDLQKIVSTVREDAKDTFWAQHHYEDRQGD